MRAQVNLKKRRSRRGTIHIAVLPSGDARREREGLKKKKKKKRQPNTRISWAGRRLKIFQAASKNTSILHAMVLYGLIDSAMLRSTKGACLPCSL